MPCRFNPSGTLDLGTDPADLPMQMQGKMAVSGALTRCTNLSLDRTGIASTRKGSAKLNGTAIDTAIWLIIEQGGFRYSFAGTIIYRDEVSIGTGFTSAQWSAILYNSYNSEVQSVFALNGTDRKRITGTTINEWGADSPTVAPTLDTGKQTGLTGAYNAKFTWARKEGAAVVWESNPSPAGDAVTLTDGSLYVLITDYPTDTQITHIRLYRTSADGSLYLHDQDIELLFDSTEYAYSYCLDFQREYVTGVVYQCFTENTATGHYFVATYSWELEADYLGDDGGYKFTHPWEEITGGIMFDSNTDDLALGTEATWLNHDRPPLGTVLLGPNFNGYCFILKDNFLYYSMPNQPEYWPADYYIEISSIQFPCKAGAFLDGQLFIATATDIYYISGTSAGTFIPLPMSALAGTVNEFCFVSVKGQGIYHLSGDGIYLYSGGKDQLISRGNLDKLWQGTTVGNIPGLNRTYINNCRMMSYHGKLYIAYPGGTSEYPDNILVMDLQTQKLVHHVYSDSWRVLAVDNTNSRLLAGDSSGYIWQWEQSNLTDDNGTAIAWQIQSADFNQLRKYFPRYARYDVKVGAGALAAGYVLLDEIVKQTHTITGDRKTRKRLVAGCTGDRLAVRLQGTGTVDIFGIEVE